mgnify:CR=1 FL=1
MIGVDSAVCGVIIIVVVVEEVDDDDDDDEVDGCFARSAPCWASASDSAWRIKLLIVEKNIAGFWRQSISPVFLFVCCWVLKFQNKNYKPLWKNDD